MSSPYEIKYPANFVPALTDYPYVTEGKYVKGTYIVAETFEEINNLPTAGLVDGAPAYVSTTRRAYRYNAGDSEWVPEELPDEVKAELELEIGQETLARQQADETLQGNIETETTARQNADNAINNRINESCIWVSF